MATCVACLMSPAEKQAVYVHVDRKFTLIVIRARILVLITSIVFVKGKYEELMFSIFLF